MLQRIEVLGEIVGIPGWHVNTVHPILEWAAYLVSPQEGRPVFNDTQTCCYTFSPRSHYYGATHRANVNNSIFPPHNPGIPTVVTMRQMRQAVFINGLTASVEAAIDSLSEPNKTVARIQWEYAQEVERFNAFIDILQGMLSLTDTQVDDLFVLASSQ